MRGLGKAMRNYHENRPPRLSREGRPLRNWPLNLSFRPAQPVIPTRGRNLRRWGQSRRIGLATDPVLADIGLRFLTEFILSEPKGFAAFGMTGGGYAKVSESGVTTWSRGDYSGVTAIFIRIRGLHKAISNSPCGDW